MGVGERVRMDDEGDVRSVGWVKCILGPCQTRCLAFTLRYMPEIIRELALMFFVQARPKAVDISWVANSTPLVSSSFNFPLQSLPSHHRPRGIPFS